YKRQPSGIQAISGATLITLAWFLFDPSSISLEPVGLLAMISAIMCIVIGSSVTKSLGTKMHWWTVLTWQLILGGVIMSIATSVLA
ncbi:EamA family transporter, partial [Vibrio parahaemolyticus]|nr:EamA family transporter [Vibrio parahaemolyticus]